jgi:hypothetical protein
MMHIEAIYEGGPCPPYISVQAQAKACGYILNWEQKMGSSRLIKPDGKSP